ncbi:MAG: phosphogluconate dehydrogenase (NAD(+)-dependent, decarboxylating) [Gemmatimonadales bacterium]
MQLAMIGLGRMGGNMTRRLLRGGHDVIAYDPDPQAVAAVTRDGANGVPNLEALAAHLAAPRIAWMMVPAGAAVDDTIARLSPSLGQGSILIDGGNSYYRDTIRRAAALRDHGVELVDAGTSGGIGGLEGGYCLMVGGSTNAVAHLEPILRTLAPPDGFAHLGPSGAGHYAKMVHNGVEYALLQAYAEGYEILHASRDYRFDLARVAAVWNRGSVIRSWLNELAERALSQGGGLGGIKGWVEDSGEGRWALQEAMDLDVPVPALAVALFARFRSRQADSFGARLIAALRREFGGHPVRSP